MKFNRPTSLVTLLIICIICPILFSGNLFAQTTEPLEPITFKDLIDDPDETYNVGETVLIQDTIKRMYYYTTEDNSEEITKIYFESEGVDFGSQKYVSVIGNAKNNFRTGEKVKVIVNILADEAGNETYTSSIFDITHVTIIKEDVEKHGIDILGFHFEFPEQLDILDNNYGRFLVKFILWVMIAFLVLIILDPIIRRMTEKTTTKIDDIVLEIIRRPVLILIILYGMVASLRELELPREAMYWIEGAYSVGFLLMVIWISYKIFSGVLIQIGQIMAKRTKLQVDKILIPAIHKLGTIIIGFVALSAVLGYLQIDLTLFIAGGVVISMVIAFAAQDTLSNFFSGIFLILEPKFKEGDMIQFEGDTYIVRKIGMRTTVMYDLFKHLEVVMPNNKLANEKLINLTEPDRHIKDSCDVGVAYGSDPQQVQDILMEITMNHPDIITDDPKRVPFTRFTEFGDSSINFLVGFWVENLDNRFRVKSEINHEIYNRLALEGIEIPFPQRDLNIKSEIDKNVKKDLPYKKKNKRLKKIGKRLKRGKLEMGSEDFGDSNGGGDGE